LSLLEGRTYLFIAGLVEESEGFTRFILLSEKIEVIERIVHMSSQVKCI